MKEGLQQLVELQEIDTAILHRSEIIESIPGKISTVEQPLKDARALNEKCRQRHESLAKKRKDKERSLDDIHEKIRKLKARTDIKTNKEYQAHLREIESAEREVRGVEDEILALMETVDDAARELREAEARVKEEEGVIEAFRGKLREEAWAVERELDELRARRNRLVDTLDKEAYRLYFKLLETKKGVAVVEARDEVCLGCNMNIPPQLFVEIKKNDRITQCPQCSRILYWKSP